MKQQQVRQLATCPKACLHGESGPTPYGCLAWLVSLAAVKTPVLCGLCPWEVTELQGSSKSVPSVSARSPCLVPQHIGITQVVDLTRITAPLSTILSPAHLESRHCGTLVITSSLAMGSSANPGVIRSLVLLAPVAPVSHVVLKKGNWAGGPVCGKDAFHGGSLSKFTLKSGLCLT